jgi:NMD protein affecting ribosome stability and mRNA decay
METHYVPLMQARTVEGYSPVFNYLPTEEEIEEAIHEDPKQILCVECGKPISPNSDFRLYEDCLKDDDVENQQLPISTNSVFRQCPNAPNSLYRLDGDYVVVKYKKCASIRTTWSDIHMMCEDENPTSTIKELLGERANTNNVAAVNAFVRAVKNGLIEVDA